MKKYSRFLMVWELAINHRVINIPSYRSLMMLFNCKHPCTLAQSERQKRTSIRALMDLLLVTSSLICLAFPVTANAIGLGDIVIDSSLNQPFNAEIELIGLGETPLNSVKVSVGSHEAFERVGLERSYVLDFLSFQVEKKIAGQAFIRVRSVERISEPYLELLIDLAWPKGQIYRVYTVLLDPPEYQRIQDRSQKLAQKKSSIPTRFQGRPGIVDKTIVSHVEHDGFASHSKEREASIYGPTQAQETIWQIAQRYKTPEVSIQQLILAILGANPDAFKAGNLNGLKSQVHLNIPATKQVKQIPEQMAMLEVIEQDKAWQAKQPIAHVLQPPYLDSPPPDSLPTPAASTPIHSVLPSIAALSSQKTSQQNDVSTFFSKPASFLSAIQDAPRLASGDKLDSAQDKLVAEMNIAAAVIETVRETNGLLNEQLRMLQVENKRLQHQLSEQAKEVSRLQKQIEKFVAQSRRGVAGQANQVGSEASGWPIGRWFLTLLILLAAAGGVYGWIWRRASQSQPIRETPAPTPILEHSTLAQADAEPLKETGSSLDDNHEIETNPLDETLTKCDSDAEGEKSRPVKSQVALQTLLELAKTYISIEDYAAARQSLEEVLAYGNEVQQAQAAQLLEQLPET